MPAIRKIVMFGGAALILIGVGVWGVANAPRGAASTQIGVDPLQIMAHAKDLPTSHSDF